MLPLLPVSRRDVIVPHRHEQDGPRDELGTHQNPWAVVPTAHVPAAIGEDPVLVSVEEEVGRRGRRVAHRRDPWNDHEWWRRRKVDADIHVHLGVGGARQDEGEKGEESVCRVRLNG